MESIKLELWVFGMDCFRRFLVTTAILFCLFVSFTHCVLGFRVDNATLEITQAEEVLVTAYYDVLDAEQSGANVSLLVDKLNLGSKYLSEAYVSYRLGEYEDSIRLADQSVGVVKNLEDEAADLKFEAEEASKNNFIIRSFGSSISVVIVIIVGFLVWRVFRQNSKKINHVKETVISNEY